MHTPRKVDIVASMETGFDHNHHHHGGAPKQAKKRAAGCFIECIISYSFSLDFMYSILKKQVSRVGQRTAAFYNKKSIDASTATWPPN